MELSSAALARAERIRNMVRKSAYGVELATGTAPLAFATPKDLSEVINSFSGVHGDEAKAAAYEINAATDPLGALSKLLPDVNDAVLNYLMAQTSYRYFCLKYFKHHFGRKMTPDYHDVYFEIIREVETHRIDKPAIIAGPPEWGKSTIGAVMLPIHCVAFNNTVYLPNGQEQDLTKRFIGLITVVEKNARRNLETIKDELEHNDLLRGDFGEFFKNPGSKSRNEPWSETVAVTLNQRRIEIFGRKGKVRGAVWKGQRLDLPIGDDLEDDENANSVIKQDRDYKWLNMIVNRTSKEKGNVMIMGNLVNPNGLLDRCVKNGEKNGWRVQVFRLYTEDPATKEKIYTWPEEFGPEYEKLKRSVTGDENFEAEFLSNPEAYFREVQFSNIEYYKYNEAFREILGRMTVYAAADPASSVTERSDFTAVGVIAEDPVTGFIYILPGVNDKVPVGMQADLILDIQAKYNPLQFGVESVAYQNALVDRLEERRRERGNQYFFCVPITHPYLQKKKERIAQRLFKRVIDKIILFPENDPVARIGVDQLVNLKTTRYDDVVDSWEMALRIRDKDLGMRCGVRSSFATISIEDPVKPTPKAVDIRPRVTVVPLSPEDPKFIARKSKRQLAAENA